MSKKIPVITTMVPDLTSRFDAEGAAYLVVAGIAETDHTIVHLCEYHGLNISSFYRMSFNDKQLSENIAIAKRIRAQRYMDEALELSKPTDDDWAQDNFNRFTANSGLLKRQEMQIKTLMTLAGKYDPEQFGTPNPAFYDVTPEAPAQLVVLPSAEAARIYHERVRRLTDGKDRTIDAEDAEDVSSATQHAGTQPDLPPKETK